MEKNQLIYVIETARLGNITKAAEHLHISQPSLSNQIINLEKELGVSLFERTRKRIYLTDAGKAFVHEAQTIVNGFTSLSQLMQEYARKNTGSLRIGALSTMCSLKIPEMIQKFQKQYSKISISLLESGSTALLNAVIHDELDVAFAVLNSALPYEGINKTRIFSSDIYAAVNAKSPFAQKSSFSLDDLSSVSLISSTEDFSLFSIILSLLENKSITYSVASKCNQIDSCLSLVDKDLGVTFCTRITAAYYKYPNVRLIPFVPALTRDVYLIYKKNPDYHPLLNAFILAADEFYHSDSLSCQPPRSHR